MSLYVGCTFLLVGFAFIFVGLVLGMRSIFVIRESRGRLRGYGLAIVSIVLSFLSLLSLPVLMLMGRSVSQAPFESHGGRSESTRSPKVGLSESDGYRALVSSLPPRNWVESVTSRTIKGPASVGAERLKPEDAAELDRIVERTAFEGFEARRVIEVTVRTQQDKATDATIVIWIALLNSNLEPVESRYSESGSHGTLLKWGRILIGIYTDTPPEGLECVKRLAKHYEGQLAEIDIE